MVLNMNITNFLNSFNDIFKIQIPYIGSKLLENRVLDTHKLDYCCKILAFEKF